MRGRWFFVVPFVLLMLWFLVILRFSPYFDDYILGHYELTTTKPLNPRPYEAISVDNAIPSAQLYMFWVANNTVEVFERAALIIGLETFLSALVSYLLYKALKNP